MATALGNIIPSRWRAGSDSKSANEHRNEYEKPPSENDVWTSHWTDNDIRNNYTYSQYSDSPLSDSTTLVNSSPELDVLNKENHDYEYVKPRSNSKPTTALNISLPWFKTSRQRSGPNDESNDEPTIVNSSNITSPIEGISHFQNTINAPSRAPQIAHPRLARAKNHAATSKSQTHLQYIDPAPYAPQSLLSALSPVCEDFVSGAPEVLHNSEVGNHPIVSPPLHGIARGNRTARALPTSRVQAAGLNVYTEYPLDSGRGRAGRRKSASLTTPVSLTDDDTESSESVPSSACSERSTTSEASFHSATRARSTSRTPAYQSEDDDEAETPRGRSANRSVPAMRGEHVSRESGNTGISHATSACQGRSASVDLRNTSSTKTLTLEDLSHMRMRSRSKTIVSHQQASMHHPQCLPLRAASREPMRRDQSKETASRRAISIEPLNRDVVHPQWSPGQDVLFQRRGSDYRSPKSSPGLVRQSPGCPEVQGRSNLDTTPCDVADDTDKTSAEQLHNTTDVKGMGLYTELSNQYRNIGRSIDASQPTVQPPDRIAEGVDRTVRRSSCSNISTPMLISAYAHPQDMPSVNQTKEDICSPCIGAAEKKRGFQILSPILKRDQKLVPNEEDLWG